MQNAQVKVEAEVFDEDTMDLLLTELWRLHKSLPPASYFRVVEDFVDRARESLSRLEDPERREHLREHYQRVIEFAVDIAAGAAT